MLQMGKRKLRGVEQSPSAFTVPHPTLHTKLTNKKPKGQSLPSGSLQPAGWFWVFVGPDFHSRFCSLGMGALGWGEGGRPGPGSRRCHASPPQGEEWRVRPWAAEVGSRQAGLGRRQKNRCAVSRGQLALNLFLAIPAKGHGTCQSFLDPEFYILLCACGE